MNYTKQKFTKEQFLDLPVYEELKDVPLDTPFLFLQRHIQQKETIMLMMEQLGVEDFNKMIEDKKNPITVQYWIKIRGKKTQNDNYQDRGGTLVL